ncbi:tRNA preQ1(34) S-adenosylmethionine ribosyltransferase-isomerase QueA [Betaproteobacteria bacterium]|nr:tRNA preQ1(34) S-adenosylmethionine ribosyltransferase-isomerase QueA [Betaproteobacteria bacterium]
MTDNKLKSYDFSLPKELIAQKPTEKRSSSRLLVINHQNDDFACEPNLKESTFACVTNFLREDDLLVFNDSKVIPVRIECFKKTGARIEIFVLDTKAIRRHDSRVYFCAMVKPKKKLRGKMKLFLGKSEHHLIVEDLLEEGSKLCIISSSLSIDVLIEQFGNIPLPPYINRAPDKLDEERYQTIYAKSAGSLAAPTAGLHFDNETFAELKRKSIETVFLTLHVGLATFSPIINEDISNHNMHSEHFFVSEEALYKILKAKQNKKRIIAVGTTSLRALESLELDQNRSDKFHVNDIHGENRFGKTNIFIKPGYKFKLVDGLITNFHLPKSTLFILISAFLGREKCLEIYQYAIKKQFRFFSYGDAMLAFRS